MEIKIYADVLFAICSLMVFTAYGAVALVSNISTSLKRVAFGSFVISLLSTVIVLWCRAFINPVSILLIAMLGTYLCFNLGITAIKQNIVYSFAALACGTLMGGVKAAMANIGLINNGLWGIVLTMVILYVCFFAVLKKIRAVTVKKQQLYPISVYRDNIRVDLVALVDTGNELKGQCLESVIIAERQRVSCLFEGAEASLRLLPFKTIDKGDGVLIGVLCDYVLIKGVKKSSVIVAAVDTVMGNGVYNALINPEMEVI